MTENRIKESPASEPEIFSGFARIWACATLIHQLAFSFWAESWPGWVLVICAIAVVFQPACLHRFVLLIVASLIHLFQKLPFVPNHILFEGILHLIMILCMIGLLITNHGSAYLRDAFQDNWKQRFLIFAILTKAAYLLIPAIPQTPLFGALTTALLLLGLGRYLFGREPVRSGATFIATAAPVLRIAIMIMYFIAAIQKSNFDYLNPDISCAAVLHTEISHYFGSLIPTGRWALHVAIWGSLLFEVGIPILLFIPCTRILGIIAAVWFHLWLSIHPAAGIFSFSALILSILYLFLPVGIWKELNHVFRTQLTKIGRGDPAQGQRITNILVTAVFLAILFTQMTLYLTMERSYTVFETANRIGYIGFVLWGGWLGCCYVWAAIKGYGYEREFPNHPIPTLAWLGLLLVVMNGAFPWVGGKTQTSFSMYSNLRSEGEGNHSFLKRIDLLPYQKNMVRVITSQPNILDPPARPKGIANFANIGHKVLPYFELRRLVTTTEGDIKISYEHDGEIKVFVREGTRVEGDPGLAKPIPLFLRKLFWFRRLNSIDGPMICTH